MASENSENSPAVVADPQYVPVRGESKVWLDMITEAQRAFKDWNTRCDNIARIYADLNRLAGIDRTKEMAIFWSTIQVINPSIYARPPVPVVVPFFKDRKPLLTISSELLERSVKVEMAQEDIDATMKHLRDDLGLYNRASAWVNYYSKEGKPDRVCPEFVDRDDFLHEPARTWEEVGWVARRSWLTHAELQKRFPELDDQSDGAVFKTLMDIKREGGATAQPKCPVWELWSKTEDKVVWVTEGVVDTLEEAAPHLKLDKFFPCPKPAYGTVQPRTLVPVPDFLQVKDQLEEINELTNRIHALSHAIKVKGFYPASGEMGDAIEAALNILNDHNIMVPIKDWQTFSSGGGSGGQPVFYWPVEIIAQVVAGLVELRNEVINNVYQIIGISDIMRGSTEKEETLGAQELKAQFGSVRIRDRQQELIRIARDLVVIMAEIMAEEFSSKALLDMSQMDIPTDAEISKQVKPLEAQARDIPKAAEKQAKDIMMQAKQQVQQAAQNPEMAAKAQQDPQAAQQALQQAEQQAQQQVQEIAQQAQQQVDGILSQIEKLQARPTVEKVMKFIRDNKLRPFVLDIETDSTILADEQAEKQSRTEFVTALGGMLNQFLPVMQAMPQTAPLFGGILKFALAPFRAGRELEGQIDEAVEALTEQQSQQQGPSPEQIAAEADAKAKEAQVQAEGTKLQMAAAAQKTEDERKAAFDQAQLAIKTKAAGDDLAIKAALADHTATLEKQRYAKQMMDMEASEIRAAQAHERDMQNKTLDIEAKQVSIAAATRQAQINEAAGAQKMEITEKQAAAKTNGIGGSSV